MYKAQLLQIYPLLTIDRGSTPGTTTISTSAGTNPKAMACAGECSRTLPPNAYTQTQWGKPQGVARCKRCTGSKGGSQLHCAGVCGRDLPQNAFSPTQWSKGQGRAARCKRCVGAVGAPKRQPKSENPSKPECDEGMLRCFAELMIPDGHAAWVAAAGYTRLVDLRGVSAAELTRAGVVTKTAAKLAGWEAARVADEVEVAAHAKVQRERLAQERDENERREKAQQAQEQQREAERERSRRLEAEKRRRQGDERRRLESQRCERQRAREDRERPAHHDVGWHAYVRSQDTGRATDIARLFDSAGPSELSARRVPARTQDYAAYTPTESPIRYGVDPVRGVWFEENTEGADRHYTR